jgi:hypothetical protein
MGAVTALSAASSAGAGHYLHWGVLSVSLTNALVIGAMLVVFVLALVVPFGRRSHAASRARPEHRGPGSMS